MSRYVHSKKGKNKERERERKKDTLEFQIWIRGVYLFVQTVHIP